MESCEIPIWYSLRVGNKRASKDFYLGKTDEISRLNVTQTKDNETKSEHFQ